MNNEAANRSAGASDGGGHSEGSRGEPAPLQSRAKFLQNWDGVSVTQINGGLCERGRAQRGVNSETHTAVAEEWEKRRADELSLWETYELLRSGHRRAPFLFFNGNTFAETGRVLTNALFRNLPFTTAKMPHPPPLTSGMLDRKSMIQRVEDLCAAAEFQPGDRVKMLRGSTQGVIVRLLKDSRIVWRPDGTKSALTALPESLSREK